MWTTLRRANKEFWRGQAIYAFHVASLLAPGRPIPTVHAHQIQPEALDKWTDAELGLMIEEGRRQVDRQLQDLDRIRARAQWLFTIGVAAVAALGTGFINEHPSLPLSAIWLLGLVGLTWGLGGAAGVMVARAEFNQIATALLSSTDPPVLQSLATSYSRMTGLGEDSIATRITTFRQAVVFSLVGGYVALLSALLA